MCYNSVAVDDEMEEAALVGIVNVLFEVPNGWVYFLRTVVFELAVLRGVIVVSTIAVCGDGVVRVTDNVCDVVVGGTIWADDVV
ncbi:unnamed protein product [Cylicostephanus goldi]|uniref:Uncharacterized protein n=1 Tax=Cylicostephanus goldi TaxID=71465 RepID=A0A3P6UX55_CYLGO|nr:unnamed protein product [Cylicostephanus goldi]